MCDFPTPPIPVSVFNGVVVCDYCSKGKNCNYASPILRDLIDDPGHGSQLYSGLDSTPCKILKQYKTTKKA